MRTGILVKGGPGELLKALQKMKSMGRIESDGSVGFYDFKLIQALGVREL